MATTSTTEQNEECTNGGEACSVPVLAGPIGGAAPVIAGRARGRPAWR
ncbi:MAG: hypothetical protein Q8S55_09670 [Methylococcaceae bacterium]|nr:hypothetical protein [Methylococcaceae bacterium]